MKKDKEYLESLIEPIHKEYKEIKKIYRNSIFTYIGTTIAILGISWGLYSSLGQKIDESYQQINQSNQRIDYIISDYNNKFEEQNKDFYNYVQKQDEKYYMLLEEIRKE